MSMQKIRFKNYRGYKTWQEIEFKPLTILVGPNSSGKSSILKLLALLFQSQNPRREEYISFQGFLTSLGSKKSASYHHSDEPISVELTSIIGDSGFTLPDGSSISGPESRTNVRWDIGNESSLLRIKSSNQKELRFQVSNHRPSYEHLYTQYREFTHKLLNPGEAQQLLANIQKDFEPIISWLLINQESQWNEKTIAKKILNDIKASLIEYFDGHGLFPKTSISGLSGRVISVAELISSSEFHELNQSYFPFLKSHGGKQFYYPSENPFGIKDILKLWGTITNDIDLSSTLNGRWITHVAFGLIGLWIDSHKRVLIQSRIPEVVSVLKTVTDYIERELSPRELHQIGPYRKLEGSLFTKRELSDLLGLDSDFNDLAKAFVDHSLALLGYDFKINIFPVSGEDDLFKIDFTLKDSKTRIPLDQMGFGFTQVLPVIFSSIKSGLKLIEQPELHLHPQVQSRLAQLFTTSYLTNVNEIISINGVKLRNAGRPLDSAFREYSTGDTSGILQTLETQSMVSGVNIIETHSEHFIRGIQLLVAEGKIKVDDVAIFYVEKNRLGNSTVKKMELEETGFFSERWPEGFFDSATKLQEALWEVKR